MSCIVLIHACAMYDVISNRWYCSSQSMPEEMAGSSKVQLPANHISTEFIYSMKFSVQVTETDKECERVIVQHIKSSFPDHAFIGEEDSSVNGTSELTSKPTWIIDPVDGTTNFVHKIPFICVCIGLAIDQKVCSAYRMLFMPTCAKQLKMERCLRLWWESCITLY